VVLIDAVGGPELTESGGEVRGALGKAREKLALTPSADEFARLDEIEHTARTKLVPLRKRLKQTVLPALADHARRIVERTPARAEDAAVGAARAHGFAGRLFPDTTGRGPRLELPVVAQTSELVAATGGWETAQMVRAATPWVQYWRKPALAFGDQHLPLSGYADFYLDVSNRLTLEVARELAERDGIHLYVLKDAGGAKGREPWTGRAGSRRADELFSLLALAHGANRGYGGSVFRNPQPDGVAAVAQTMLYNANPQDPDRVPPAPLQPADWQPVVGWDTLNWNPDVRVPEYRFGLKRDEGQIVQPTVLTNWRARLTPVTRLGGVAVAAGDDELGRILRRTDPSGWPANTH
jgi:hypothetical protein